MSGPSRIAAFAAGLAPTFGTVARAGAARPTLSAASAVAHTRETTR